MTIETINRGFRVGRTGKVLLGLWCLFLIGGFLVAVSLSPDPRGYGTHQRLGFPPCSIRSLFGIPCPTCGMTTSFANFVRGRFVESVRANVAGFLLACVCAVQIPWCLASLRSGRMWRVSRPQSCLMWVLAGILGLSIVQWIARVWLL